MDNGNYLNMTTLPKIKQPTTPAGPPTFQMSDVNNPNSGVTLDANQPSQFPQPGQNSPTPTTQSGQGSGNANSQNPPVDSQDQATVTKWRAAGLSDQQIAIGLLKRKQAMAAGGYNPDGTPSSSPPGSSQQNYDPFGGRTKQQVLALAFQSGITDSSSLTNIGKTYDLVTNGGTTDQTAQLQADISSKMTFGAVLQKYGNSMSPDAIVEAYDKYSPYGQVSSSSIQTAKTQGYNITSSSDSAVSQDIKDAQSAIDQGANPTAVKKRFLEIHPQNGSAFDNAIQ